MKRTVTRILVMVPLALMLTGCGIIDYFYLPVADDTAQELYEAGVSSMQEKNYGDAAEFFTKLKDRYPFSPYTPRAELALGDAQFMDGKYLPAVETYKEFESLHPRHEQMPYVLYQIGMANYKSVRTIDRPLTHVEDAIQYFRRLGEVYPNSEYAKKGAEYITKCRHIMAEHELFVADYYWNSGKYRAAWERYRFVLASFGDMTDLTPYAAKRAELAYLRFREDDSQDVRDKREGSWKDYFDWL